jgi:uncharacterized protein YndB with AHSA1/START domain
MPAGLTQDAGWNVGVSRTLPHPPEAVWEFIASPVGIELWLGEGAVLPAEPRKGDTYSTKSGTGGEVRGYRRGTRIRVTYGRTTAQVTVSSAPDGRAVLNFHQERMSSAEEREAQRGHWEGAMEGVRAELG